MSHSTDEYPNSLLNSSNFVYGSYPRYYSLQKIYLAGPMRGLWRYNFPLFEKVAKRLRLYGFTVWSPAEHDLESGFDPDTPMEDLKPLREYMKDDLANLLEQDAVVLLDGWRTSQGAYLEATVADTVGIPLYDQQFNRVTLKQDPITFLAEEMSFLDSTEKKAAEVMEEKMEAYIKNSKANEDKWLGRIDKWVVTDDATGGQKEQSKARYDLLPWDSVTKIAELYGYGASKYDDRNWEKGYNISLSIAALGRHYAKLAQGIDIDEESGQHHAACICFHAMAVMRFMDDIESGRLSPEHNDRPGVG